MGGVERHYLGAAAAELVRGARVRGLGRPLEGVGVALKLAEPLTASHHQTLGGVEHLPVTRRPELRRYASQPLRNCKTALQF